MDLFDRLPPPSTAARAPLADRMRPKRLRDIVGQTALLGPSGWLARAITADRVPSLILWGPPGSGKTTLAMTLASESKARLVTHSAVLAGVPELRKAIGEAREHARLHGRRTILFIDEIHRYSKAQQDALLPHVERGTVTLIGATTENPSFAINAALLSRTRVFRLAALSDAELVQLLARALDDAEHGLAGTGVRADASALATIAAQCDGDARRALGLLEALVAHAQERGQRELTPAALAELGAQRTLSHDKTGDAHYDVASAFIKSLRGSDPDAALYWMMRLIDAGEDPRFVLRRMIIFASEDVGNAEPRALPLAVAADAAHARLGMPEALHALAQACTFLACAPKSNASYAAFAAARKDVEAHGALPVPLRLRNAPTQLAKTEGHGAGYRYPHDEGGFAAGETYLPEALTGARYYEPKPLGEETAIAERLRTLRGAR